MRQVINLWTIGVGVLLLFLSSCYDSELQRTPTEVVFEKEGGVIVIKNAPLNPEYAVDSITHKEIPGKYVTVHYMCGEDYRGGYAYRDDAKWLTLDQDSTGTVIITAQPNTTGSPRCHLVDQIAYTKLVNEYFILIKQK